MQGYTQSTYWEDTGEEATPRMQGYTVCREHGIGATPRMQGYTLPQNEPNRMAQDCPVDAGICPPQASDTHIAVPQKIAPAIVELLAEHDAAPTAQRERES